VAIKEREVSRDGEICLEDLKGKGNIHDLIRKAGGAFGEKQFVRAARPIKIIRRGK